MLTDVVGQPEGVAFLRRIRDHRYRAPLLLVGDEGVGRRFAVLQLAKEILCDGTRDNSCTCFQCEQIDQKIHPDVSIFESPGKSLGIAQVREAIEISSMYPSFSSIRLIVIDGADQMTVDAANAILKTLEESVQSARFFLLAQQSTRVLSTIRSRCGEVRFRSLPETFICTKVSAQQSDPAKALIYARMAEGSVGRAIRLMGAGRLSLRDKVYSTISAAVRKDLPSVFSVLSSLEKDLPDSLRFLEQLVHDILMIPISPDRLIHTDLADSLRQSANGAGPRSWQILSEGAHRLNSIGASSGINLLFHTQALFVDAFFGV